MQVSVIIPTRHRPDLLRGALLSLSHQTARHRSFEVLVVDNGPSAENAAITNSFRGAIAEIRYVEETSPGLHNARHRGLLEARADILVYIDDDIEAVPGWIESIIACFTRADVVLVGGKNLPKYEVPPPRWLLREWDAPSSVGRYFPYLSILDMGDEPKEIDPFYVFGCNFSIRREVIVAAGGFHPDGMPQELIRFRGDGEGNVCCYVKEKGLKTLYHPGVSIFHLVPRQRMTIEYLAQRAFNQGISDSFCSIRGKGGVSSREVLKGSHLDKWITRHKNAIFRYAPCNRILHSVMRGSYIDGYNYHTGLACTDAELLAWTLRETWLD